jgi:hypothetical protein
MPDLKTARKRQQKADEHPLLEDRNAKERVPTAAKSTQSFEIGDGQSPSEQTWNTAPT